MRIPALALVGLLGVAAPVTAAAARDVTEHLKHCADCHGADGRSSALPANGRIAGQHREYLVYILKQYRTGGIRGLNSGIMSNAVRHLDDADIEAIAEHYSTLP
jgi:cytochrome c553